MIFIGARLQQIIRSHSSSLHGCRELLSSLHDYEKSSAALHYCKRDHWTGVEEIAGFLFHHAAESLMVLVSYFWLSALSRILLVVINVAQLQTPSFDQRGRRRRLGLRRWYRNWRTRWLFGSVCFLVEVVPLSFISGCTDTSPLVEEHRWPSVHNWLVAVLHGAMPSPGTITFTVISSFGSSHRNYYYLWFN